MKCEEWTVKIGKLFGVPLAKLISKLPFNVTPNTVTILSLWFAISAGYHFFINQLIIGAVLFWISYCLDCADGELAQLTNQKTKFGEKLDFSSDILGNIFMYFGLWYSQFHMRGHGLLGGSLIFAHYCVMAFGYMFITDRTYKTKSSSVCSYYSAADEGFFTFLALPLFNLFYIGLPIVIGLQAISYAILSFRQKEKLDIIDNIKRTLKFKEKE